jgi:hypothetical protein
LHQLRTNGRPALSPSVFCARRVSVRMYVADERQVT